jgi:hypothetical protein
MGGGRRIGILLQKDFILLMLNDCISGIFWNIHAQEKPHATFLGYTIFSLTC